MGDGAQCAMMAGTTPMPMSSAVSLASQVADEESDHHFKHVFKISREHSKVCIHLPRLNIFEMRKIIRCALLSCRWAKKYVLKVVVFLIRESWTANLGPLAC